MIQEIIKLSTGITAFIKSKNNTKSPIDFELVTS